MAVKSRGTYLNVDHNAEKSLAQRCVASTRVCECVNIYIYIYILGIILSPTGDTGGKGRPNYVN